MTTKFFYQRALLFIALLALGACTTSLQRFPDYGDVAKQQSSIPVILDLFTYRDIAGVSRGYNNDANRQQIEQALAQIDIELSERGFSTHHLKTLNGLTYEQEKGKKYVISEDWKSTGKAYNGLQLNHSDDVWLSDSAREFVLDLFDVAKEINLENDKDQKYAENIVIENSEGRIPQRMSDIEIDPQMFEGVQSDIILFVKTTGRNQRLEKFLVKGVLVGGLTNALTGGLVLIPAGTYIKTEVVAFNVNTRQILWHNEAYAEVVDAVNNSIKKALKPYPYSDGETLWQKEKRQPKRRKRMNR